MQKKTTFYLLVLMEVLLIIAAAKLAAMLLQPALPSGPGQVPAAVLDSLLPALLACPLLLWRGVAHLRKLETSTNSLRTPQIRAISLGVLLFGLLLTGASVHELDKRITKEAAARYDRLHERLVAEVQRRFTLPVYGLRGAAGGIIATRGGMLAPDSFRAYIHSRDLPAEFPGVRGFGFIQPVPRARLARFEAEEQRTQSPAFHVVSHGNADPLYVIRYIEPLADNREAWGYDAGADAVSRSAITHALERGKPTMTGSIALRQDKLRTPGYLILVPVFRPGHPLDSFRQRQQALLGLVYTPVIVRELMQGVSLATEQNLDFELFDSPLPTPGSMVYDDDRHAVASAASTVMPDTMGRSFVRMQRLETSGRTLTLRSSSTALFDASINRSSLAVVAIMGFIMSVLAGFSSWLLLHNKQRAEQLAASMTKDLALLAKVARHTTNAIIITDNDRYITWVNEGFTRLTGYTLEEVRNQQADTLLPSPHSDPEVLARIRQALTQQQPFQGKLLNRAKSGRDYWVTLEIQPLRDEQQQLQGFMAVESDISLQEAIQADLHRALLETQTVHDIIQQHFIVSIADPDGHIISANQAFTDISGYSLSELLHQNHRLLNAHVHEPAFWQDMWQTLARGQPWRGDVCNRRKDGSLYWVDSIIAPFMNPQGDIERYVSIRRDITASKAHEASLQEAKHQAEQASQAKSRFLANMSHEIRTPMNAILGLLQLLQHTPLAAEQQDYVDKTEAAARSLLGLLNDILDFSKVEAGKMTLDIQPFRLDQLMHNLAVILSATSLNKPIELIFHVDAHIPPWLTGDAMRLQQVLINLAGNAIKFTEAGEVLVRITQQARTRESTTLLFSVRDTGIGISSEQRDKLFHSFSQAETSTTRRYGGTGLGLAISQRMVQLMGSEIRVESQTGKGSCFSFELTLPVAASLGEPPALPASKALSVLIVDDNAVAREATSAMVNQLGWQASCLESGEQLLGLLASLNGKPLPYQLVLIDWQMPGLDGWASCRELRRYDSQVQMIMVTAHGRDMLAARSDRERGLLAGFLVKPVTLGMLREAVDKLQFSAPAAPTGNAANLESTPQQMPALAGLRLLLVEDNATNRLVAKGLLGKEGAEVDMAENGELAVRAVASMSPRYDAILMDLQMPVMDGLTATREIRQALGETRLPIIAMTANAMHDDRLACLAAGMNDHIGKPFAIADLRDMLLRHIAAAQAGE